MATNIHISGLDEVRELSNRFNLLPQKVQTASARAINRALTAVRALGKAIAKEAYTAPAKELAKGIKTKQATRGDLEGNVEFRSGRGVPLHWFQPSPRKRPDWKNKPVNKRNPKAGISTKIKKSGQRKVKLSDKGQKPFFIPMKNGEIRLFYRTSKKSLPIEKAFGPSPVQALLKEDAQRRLEERGQEVFSKRFRHEFRRIIGEE